MFPTIYSILTLNQLLSLINLLITNKQTNVTLKVSKKQINLLLLLQRSNLLYISVVSPNFFCLRTPFFQFNYLFYKIIYFSVQSKIYNISLKALKLLVKRLGRSVIFLSTSLGYLTHEQALKYKVGGRILFLILT